VLLKEQIIGVRPVDAADLVDVAKPFGDQQRGARAGAFKHRVDRDRRTVQEQTDGAIIGPGLGDARGNPFDQVRRRRQRLAERGAAGRFVKHRDIGKRTADVGGEPQSSRRRSSLCHVRSCLSPAPSVAAVHGAQHNQLRVMPGSPSRRAPAPNR
jgi:hypothetical protein